jgi:hypothetical protein
MELKLKEEQVASLEAEEQKVFVLLFYFNPFLLLLLSARSVP